MPKQTFSVSDLGVLISSIFVCLLAGGVGAIFTTSQIQTWYQFLDKPPLVPPNWVFGPVWTTLYLMMGVALFLVLKYATQKKDKDLAIKWFAAQLVFNVLWSMVFFGANSPGGGVAIILVLWMLILMTIKQFEKIKPVAGWLLVPYLLWVSFATYLNAGIWWLN